MSSRTRVLVWLSVLAVVAGAVVTLRATEDPKNADPDAGLPAQPVVVDRFAADNVVVPQPGRRPRPPTRLVVTPEADALRVSWADALPGGVEPAGAAGYEVRWAASGGPERTRMVATPDVQLDGLRRDTRYRVDVRTVDAFGRRSAPATASGVTARAKAPWREALTGLFDDFSDSRTVLSDTPGSLWHLSGYPGCVDLGTPNGRGLPIQLGCGADKAVLRARQPMVLTGPLPSGELGRIAVRTDTAGPGGELTVDLVPGPADRVDAARVDRGADRDPTLPGGTVRVAVDDAGARVVAAPDVPATAPTLDVHAAPRRGPGVAHLFEVVFTTSGVRVYQDGLPVAVGGVVPSWRSASVLLGFRGPEGHGSVAHLSAAGFSGPATEAPSVAEVRVSAGTQRVLEPAEASSQLGIARRPLVSAASARLVATMAIAEKVDPFGVVVQFGDAVVPAPPVVAAPSRVSGAALTVVADVPQALLAATGPDSITPFALRVAGATEQVQLVEIYLEITPGPAWRPIPTPPRSTKVTPRGDVPPVVEAVLCNSAGEPLTSAVVPRRGQVVLTVTLNAERTQWETGGIAGVQGFQVWLDRTLVAGVPTREEGPGLGGRYALAITVGGLTEGAHAIEVREYVMDGERRPVSRVVNFTVR